MPGFTYQALGAGLLTPPTPPTAGLNPKKRRPPVSRSGGVRRPAPSAERVCRAVGRPGFTLFELMLVLAILIIFSALSYPSVNAFYGSHQLTRAADMVRTGWAEARAHAIDEGRPYRFAIVPNKGNYRLAPHAPEYWSNDPPPAPADTADPPLVLTEALPKGLRFSTGQAVDAAGPSSLPAAQVPMEAWSSKVIFLPDGTAKSDVEITFGAKGTRELNLRLRALTGAVTVRWSPNRENSRP